MKPDSRCSSGKSGHLANNRILPRQIPKVHFQCSHCILLFASKIMLLQHLGKDHDLDVSNALKHASSSEVDDVGRHINLQKVLTAEKCASALHPEGNKPNRIPAMLNKIHQQVATKKPKSHITKPTSKDKRLKLSQETSIKITQYFTSPTVPNVKSLSTQGEAPQKVQSANTAKKTLISRKRGPSPVHSHDLDIHVPKEVGITILPDQARLEKAPPRKKPKHGLIKIKLPTWSTRKSIFPENSRLTLEFSADEEDHNPPKVDMNPEEPQKNADLHQTKPMEAVPPEQSPPESEADPAALFKCDSCTFDHTSLLTMFLHYQKNHPELDLTLEQIRQTRGCVSDTRLLVLSETSTESISMDAPNQEEKLMDPPGTSSGSPQTTMDQMFGSDAFSSSSTSKDRNPTLIVADQKARRTNSLSKVKSRSATKQREAEKTPAIHRRQSGENSPTRAGLTPPQMKCAMEGNDVPKRDCSSVTGAPAGLTDNLKAKGDGEERDTEVPLFRKKRWKKMFFCPKCNYGHVVKNNVVVHWKTKHKQSTRNKVAKTVAIYTELLRTQMEKSKNNGVRVLSSGLPLPVVLGKGMFFCPTCNYSNQHLPTVMTHRKMAHGADGTTKGLVLSYTAEVYDQPIEEQLKFKPLQISSVAHLSSGKERETGETILPKRHNVTETRPFLCHKCAYRASNVFNLKVHLSKKHSIHQTNENILRKAFDKGFIKEGYYCQWCNFSINHAGGIYDHYKEMHKSNVKSVSYISNNLHVAPKQATPKRLIASVPPVPSPKSPGKHNKTYSCQKCSSEFSSSKGITRHHRLAAANSNKCFLCCASFSSAHGLNIHLGARHAEKLKDRPLEGEQLAELDDAAGVAGDRIVRSLVFKCPWCSFVHIVKLHLDHHCQTTHPGQKVGAEGYERFPALIPPRPGRTVNPTRTPRRGGYLCLLCHELYVSTAKLQVHYMERHEDSAAEPDLRPAAEKGIKEKLLSGYHSAEGSRLSTSPICSHRGKTKAALKKHVRACKMIQASLKCSYHPCQFKTQRAGYLKRHYKLMHGADGNYTDEKSRQCKRCLIRRTFSSHTALSGHYSGFHKGHFKMDFLENHSLKKSDLPGYTCLHCGLKVKTMKELCGHLDDHRESQTRTLKEASSAVPTSNKSNGTKLQKSPSPQIEPPGSEDHVCEECGCGFPSLSLLHVHERSHKAAEACLKQCLPPSTVSQEIWQTAVRIRTGVDRRFECLLCTYRASLFGRLKRHILHKHWEDLPKQDAGPSKSVEEEENVPPTAGGPHSAPQPAATTPGKYTAYSEPAEVQRQLNHYRSRPTANRAAPSGAGERDDGRLHCEFCDWSNRHWNSVRRHYLKNHNKPMLRCTECSFFTGLSKNLDLHMAMGHSGPLAPAPPPMKTLQCPLCLYYTQNQNHLVDHVALHRQERVVPMEVRRPKLSRYLQGVVFRCHQCTFTSGSASSLATHLRKHSAVRPFQCRLCYFECARLGELEAHLCDKHQVVRNHELVGQVNLDRLGAQTGPAPEGGRDSDEDGDQAEPGSGNDRRLRGAGCASEVSEAGDAATVRGPCVSVGAQSEDGENHAPDITHGAEDVGGFDQPCLTPVDRASPRLGDAELGNLEMPVLENVYLNQGNRTESDDASNHGAPTDAAGPGPLAEDNEVFNCCYCGRKFSNGPDLQCHVTRHGM